MWKNLDYETCRSFIHCQLNPDLSVRSYQSPTRPAITISRMTGAGGRTISTKLAEYLQARAPSECRWTVFDRNLMEKVLEDHHLSKRIAAFVPEKHKSMFNDMVEEILGMHPSAWTLVQQSVQTILRLAQVGDVILVGRGANVITRRLPNVFHVRLVGSLEKRIERVQEVYRLDRRSAVAFLQKEDKGRERYLKDYFDKDIDDALLYHLILNTDRIRYDDAACLIGDEVISRFQLGQHRASVMLG